MTANLKTMLENVTLRRTRIEFDSETEESCWVTYDRDGDVMGGYETIEEAIAECLDTEAGYDEEARLEERDELIDTIQGLASECDDVEVLRQIRLLLIQANR